MNRSIQLILILISSYSASAQWIDISVNSNENLKRIQMLTDSLGYVNSSNILFKTESAGNQWDTVYYENNATIIDFHFINNLTGYLTKNTNQQNILIKTNDGGISWTTIGQAPSGVLIFTSETKGYVSSSAGFIHYTIDGGNNWQYAPDGHPSSVVGDIYFVTDSIGYIAGWYPGGIAKTTDAGVTWIHDNNVGVGCFDIFFTVSQTGYIVGWWEAISKTENGGNSWTSLYNNPNGGLFRAIDCINSDNCYVVGDSAKVLKTNNGSTFVIDTIPTTVNLYGVEMTNKYCYIIGDSSKVFRNNHGILLSNSVIKKPQIKFEIFPNPTSDVVLINIKSNSYDVELIKLFDLQGKFIKDFSGDSKILDVSNVPGGTYSLQFKTNDGFVTKKVIIQ